MRSPFYRPDGTSQWKQAPSEYARLIIEADQWNSEWGPRMRTADAEALAAEWAAEWFSVDEARDWLGAGAGVRGAKAAAALREAGVTPELGGLRLGDDRKIHPMGPTLVQRVEMGNIPASNAYALLLMCGYVRAQSGQ